MQRFSSHQLDQILLLKTYNNPVSGEHRYTPSASDARVSSFLLSVFEALANDGNLDAIKIWPRARATGHGGAMRSLFISEQPRVVEAARKAKCAYWEAHGFGRLAWNN